MHLVHFRTSVLFGLLLFPLQALSLKLNPVVSKANSTVIHPNDEITVSWTNESGDPPRFDIDLLWANGNLTTIAPDVDGSLTRTLVKLGDVPAPAVYNIAVYVFGNPVVPKGPSFTVTPDGSSSSTSTSGSPTSSTTNTPGATSSSSSGIKKVPPGALIGGIVGGVGLLVIIGVLAFCFFRRRKAESDSPVSEVSPFDGGPSSVEAGGAKSNDREMLMQQNQLLNERIGALERALEPTLNTPPAYTPPTETPAATSPIAATKSRTHVGTPSVTRTDGS